MIPSIHGMFIRYRLAFLNLEYYGVINKVDQ